MDAVAMIRLSVPGELSYRDLVLRVVASSCKLVRARHLETQEASHEDFHEQFDTKVVSAVSEVFNNVAIHGYAGRTPGPVDLSIELGERHITLRLSDHGARFDLVAETEDGPASLPESHMGLFIVQSFMDEVSYQPGDGNGTPNVMTLTKHYRGSG